VSERLLATVLERFAAVTRSVMDASPPILSDGSCALCCMQVAEVPEGEPYVPVVEHDPSECGWWIARNQVAGNDVQEVLRLAHVLRFDGASQARDGRMAP
jgi:hypothetical protein